MSDTNSMLKIIRGMNATRIKPGLTHVEIDEVEARFSILFPPDLRELLMAGLPTGASWPNWRKAVQRGDHIAAEAIDQRLDWPRQGMCFDVEHNAFWDPEWGDRPSSLADALRIAEEAVRAAPRLIPVYGHRYLPQEPCIAGNPVFSVYQMDIIVYGSDLYYYFLAESDKWSREVAVGERPIRSWTRWMLAEWS